MARFSLVTVLYNSVGVLDGFFESLAKQTHTDWELLVIDNSPGEESISRARELASHHGLTQVRFLRNHDNLGIAKGNNQGIRLALEGDCDYVVLLNNDIEFPENLLVGISDEIARGQYDILVPKVRYYDSGKLWYAGGHINRFTATVRHYGDREEDGPRYARDGFTGYAPTCFMAIRREVFAKVGFMDERFFVYYDDTDFVLRCVRAGLKLRYLGRLSLDHKVSTSTGGGSSKFSIYHYNRNRLLFIKKNERGLMRAIASVWYFATRTYKLIVYSDDERRVLVKAMRDGLAGR